MAQQHYYSRVPARMSMFNKTDGFDTFACSKGIDLAFAEDTLRVVDEIKLTASDNSEIRGGNWSPCYVQFNTAKGGAVQSRITYLPLDYTSERPGYMVHSLILNNDERQKMIYDLDAVPVNSDLFAADLNAFDLLSADSEPIGDLPEIDYVCLQNRQRDLLVQNYPAETVKRFLYSVLAATCGKLRNMYILLDDDQASDPAFMLGMIDSVYGILPIQLRSTFTFATRVNNITHLPVVKIKGIAASSISKDIPAAKGASADLATGRFTGIRDEDISACIDTVDLYFDMLNDGDLRDTYFEFCRHLYDNTKQNAAFTFKNLCELTTLFKAGSGLFDQTAVLPDNDSVGEFLALYAAYRDALPDDMRVRMITCIKRYSDAGVEIPKKVFTRITKLYKDEPGDTKEIIMQCALELIHTDAMRDKLFVFIKSCYDSEQQETRDTVLTHLVSVFYGGFLQRKLIDFFAEKYMSAGNEVKREILQKILLTVRTTDIRDRLIAFVDSVWNDLDNSGKRLVIECYAEQLSEGDDLARELLKQLDRLLPESDELLQVTANDLIISDLEVESADSGRPLLALLVPPVGYCAERVASWALCDADDDLFDCYVSMTVSNGSLKERVSAIYKAYEILNGNDVDDADVYAKLVGSAERGFNNNPCETYPDELLAVISALPECDFTSFLTDSILHPLLSKNVASVFYRVGSGVGVETLVEYKRTSYPELENAPGFKMLTAYLQLKKAFLTNDIVAMLAAASIFGNDKAFNASVGSYAEADLAVADGDMDPFVCKSLTVSYLKKGCCDVGSCYTAWLEYITRQYADMRDDTLEKANVALISMMLTKTANIYTASNVAEDVKQSLVSDAAGIDSMVINAVTRYGNPAKQYIKKRVAELSLADSPVAEICNEAFKRAKPSGDILSRVLAVFKKR